VFPVLFYHGHLYPFLTDVIVMVVVVIVVVVVVVAVVLPGSTCCECWMECD